jgi:murein L,D-transpeptidase YcbB/YkuD
MGYTKAQADAFIAKIAPLIRADAEKRGYHTCAAVIAQAVIESAAGTSGLAKWFNYFGLKAGSSWKGNVVNLKTKEEYTVGKLTTITDGFRVYSDMADGVKGYYDFISTKRYANLKTATDYKQYATLIKADGYATSSTYVKTLCDTVAKYGLTAWDKSYNAPISTSQPPSNGYPTLRKGSKGPYVKELQTILNYSSCGAHLLVDGIFGNNTLNAVIQFQGMRGLKKDGIVGPKTWAELQK